MKNLIFFLAISFLIISCESDSSDDMPNNEEPTDGVLLKREVYNYDTEQYILDFNYDGNRLTSINSDGVLSTQYYYENDLLVKFDDYSEGELYATVTFEYNDEDTLLRYIINDFYENDTTVYDVQFNNDQTIDITVSNEDSSEIFTIWNVYIENRNIVKEVSGYGQTFDFTYDSMNNPFGNIFAIDILKLVPSDFGGFDDIGVSNNILTETDTYVEGNISYTDVLSYTYQYNSSGYPTSAEIFYDGDIDGTIEYFYE